MSDDIETRFAAIAEELGGPRPKPEPKPPEPEPEPLPYYNAANSASPFKGPGTETTGPPITGWSFGPFGPPPRPGPPIGELRLDGATNTVKIWNGVEWVNVEIDLSGPPVTVEVNRDPAWLKAFNDRRKEKT